MVSKSSVEIVSQSILHFAWNFIHKKNNDGVYVSVIPHHGYLTTFGQRDRAL